MKKRRFKRHLIIAVEYEIDCTETDQLPENIEEDIANDLASELDYEVVFKGKLGAGNDALNAVEVPVVITNTEVVDFILITR